MIKQEAERIPKKYRNLTREIEHMSNVNTKVKAIPLQAWRGPEGSRRLGLLDLKTVGT